MKFYLGAYAASPAWSLWDRAIESDYYQQIAKFEGLTGLELPFCGAAHPHDEAWFLANLNPSWDYLFTCIPGIMDRIKDNPHFGLASTDNNSRLDALNFIKQAQQSVHKINAASGRQAVQGIEIQTAPSRKNSHSSASALTHSLAEIMSWDWQGCKILIEHCDALSSQHTPAKGFLSLAEEIQAVDALTPTSGYLSDLGFVINWARSAIEARDIAIVDQHCSELLARGLLHGMMFSGVSASDGPYGIWQDTHMPPPVVVNGKRLASASLLTTKQIQLTADKVKHGIQFSGLKISVREADLTIEERVECLRQSLLLVQSAF